MASYKNKKIVCFDLDGTLTKSRMSMDSEMIDIFSRLVERFKVGVISGGKLSQFEKQLIDPLKNNLNLSNLVLLPSNGTAFYIFKDGSWQIFYEQELSSEEKKIITQACLDAIKETGYEKVFEEKNGEVTDKKGQMSLSIYNPDWNLEDKMKFDPDREKRQPIRELIQKKLPNYEVKIGGTTTIDVTPKGIDKAYAMKKIIEYFHSTKEDTFFVGDAVFPGGNDYAAAQVVDFLSVSDEEETKKFIKSFLEENN